MASNDWLADRSRPAPLRRPVAECRDDVICALTARACDTATQG